MKDTKVSVVQAHRDAHAPESAGLYAGCGSGNIERRCLQKNDFSESAQLRGQVFFVHFLESCSKNFPSTNISPPHRRGCAEAADSSARVYGSTPAERARNRFGKSNCERATARTRIQHMHFLICDISAPPPSGEQSEARGSCTAASNADLPLLASWMRSASHTHVEHYQSGSILLVQQPPEPSYPTAGSAGVGCSNWDESRASPAPGAG